MAMKRSLPIAALPVEVRVEDAVEMACAEDVTFIEERLRRGMSVLVECDKELALHVYLAAMRATFMSTTVTRRAGHLRAIIAMVGPPT